MDPKASRSGANKPELIHFYFGPKKRPKKRTLGRFLGADSQLLLDFCTFHYVNNTVKIEKF